MAVQALTLADFLLARIGEDEAGIEWLRTQRAVDCTRLAREVEAKRRILAEHPAPSCIGTPGARLACDRCSNLGGPYGYDDPANWIDWPCPTLRALAAIYADHPDYRW